MSSMVSNYSVEGTYFDETSVSGSGKIDFNGQDNCTIVIDPDEPV